MVSSKDLTNGTFSVDGFKLHVIIQLLYELNPDYLF